MRVYDVGSANWAANLEKRIMAFMKHLQFSWTTQRLCISKLWNNRAEFVFVCFKDTWEKSNAFMHIENHYYIAFVNN